jgi:hypothetical protein
MRPDKARMITALKQLVKDIENPQFDIGSFIINDSGVYVRQEFHGNVGDNKLFTIKLTESKRK